VYRITSFLVLLMSFAAQLEAQTLRESLSELFTFGECGEPLCLDVDADVHGQHYVPNIVQGEDNMLAFLTGAISTSLGQIPFPSANSGQVLVGFDAGVPLVESVSPGPVLAERSQTLGRGTYLVGLNLSAVRLRKIRGIGMDDLVFRFAHQNVEDQSLGDPSFERDLVVVNADIQLDLLAASVSASYGLTDRIDVGVLVPLVRSSLNGTSSASIIDVLGGPPGPAHQFTEENPFQAERSVDNSAIGIGDVGLRLKANVHQTSGSGIGVVVDARLPTGSEDDFLGTGQSYLRALLITSGRVGAFSPHVNTGFALRSGATQNNSFLATAGFDWTANSRVTLAADALVDLHIGAPNLVVPNTEIFSDPSGLPVLPTNFPDQSDHLVDVAVGVKFQPTTMSRFVANVLVPLRDAGVRPTAMFTAGYERTFGGR
jgi:hypothetical protein